MSHTDIDRAAIPRKTCLVFFLVDTSDFMAGQKIAALNSAIEETLAKFSEMNAVSADIEIEVAFLEFSYGARWLTPNGPIKVENYFWSDLDAGGLSDMGEAFRLLEEKLQTGDNGFFKREKFYYSPILWLMSAAAPSDDYKAHLIKLKENKWFKKSIKIALAIGDDVNDLLLTEFTGRKTAVVRVPDGISTGYKLSKMVRFIAPWDDCDDWDDADQWIIYADDSVISSPCVVSISDTTSQTLTPEDCEKWEC